MYDPTSRGAVAYRELAREVLRGPVVPVSDELVDNDENDESENGSKEAQA